MLRGKRKLIGDGWGAAVRSLIITQYAPLPPARGGRWRLQTPPRICERNRQDQRQHRFPGLGSSGRRQGVRGSGTKRCVVLILGPQRECHASCHANAQQKTVEPLWCRNFLCGGTARFLSFVGPDQMNAVRTALNSKPDLTFIFRLGAMLPVLQTGIKPERILFDLDDLEHVAKIRKFPY